MYQPLSEELRSTSTPENFPNRFHSIDVDLKLISSSTTFKIEAVMLKVREG